MIRLVTLLLALALCSQNLPQQRVFRATATSVGIDVAVEVSNVPVSDLTTADFELRDNGVPQQIDALAITAIPVDVTLVVDVSNSAALQLENYRRDVAAIAGSLRPIDRLRVISMDSAIQEILPLTSANGTVAVARLETGLWSSVYDGIAAALLRQSATGRRHLIVGYTDGGDNRSILTGNQLVELGKTSEAVLHIVAPGDLPEIIETDRKPCDPAAGGSGGLLKTDTVYDPVRGRIVDAWESEFRGEKPGKLPPCLKQVLLEQAVRATGGRVHAGAELAGSFIAIFRDFLNSYVLYFQPTRVSSTGWHDVSVKVMRPGQYTVHARRGYFAGAR